MGRYKTICPLDCPDTCGLLATVDKGRLLALGGDPGHPNTAGFICRKMHHYPERYYSDKRVLYPARRIGPKGAGRFARISWDEALTIIADRLLEIRNKEGGEAILPYVYAGNMGVVNRFAGYPLFAKLATTRLQETICSATAGAGWQKHLDNTPGCPPENAATAELIVAWGINIKVSNVHFWPHVAAARKRGGRLLVIDPYRNSTAKSADFHLPVLPGGDVALALGTLKVLVTKQLIDKNFIDHATTGFEHLRDYVQTLPWRELERESGLARRDMEWLAELLGTTRKTFIRIGIGLTRNSRGAMAVRSIVSLAAGLGLFGGGDGRGVLLTSRGFSGNSEKLTWPALAGEQTRSVNMVQLGYALHGLQPKIKAVVVYNCNPATVAPDTSMVRQGLANEDVFTVVHEQTMTPTARFADILLPATTFLENRDLYTSYGHFYTGAIQPVLAPMGESRSNFDFFQALAQEMGFTDPPFQQTVEQRLTDYLSSLDGLPEGGIARVLAGEYVRSCRHRTDGRVLAAGDTVFRFSTVQQTAGPATAMLVPAGEYDDPDLLTRFSFRLITPPHPDLLNSTFGERYEQMSGEVLVHPEDGAPLGLQDGAMARIYNLRGSCLRSVRLTDDTRRGVLVAEGLFWSSGDGTINELTSQKTADMAGGGTFHESLVGIAPILHEKNVE